MQRLVGPHDVATPDRPDDVDEVEEGASLPPGDEVGLEQLPDVRVDPRDVDPQPRHPTDGQPEGLVDDPGGLPAAMNDPATRSGARPSGRSSSTDGGPGKASLG